MATPESIRIFAFWGRDMTAGTRLALSLPVLVAMVFGIASGARAQQPSPSVASGELTAPELVQIRDGLLHQDLGIRRLAHAELMRLDSESFSAIDARLDQIRSRARDGGSLDRAAMWMRVRSEPTVLERVFAMFLDAEAEHATREVLDALEPVIYAALMERVPAEHPESLRAMRLVVRALTVDGSRFAPELRAATRRLELRLASALLLGPSTPTNAAQIAINQCIASIGADDAGATLARAVTQDPVLAVELALAYARLRRMNAMRAIGTLAGHDNGLVREGARNALRMYGKNATWVLREALATRSQLDATAAPSAMSLSALFTKFEAVLDQEREARFALGGVPGTETSTRTAAISIRLSSDPRVLEQAAFEHAALASTATEKGDAQAARGHLVQALALAPRSAAHGEWEQQLSVVESIRARPAPRVTRWSLWLLAVGVVLLMASRAPTWTARGWAFVRGYFSLPSPSGSLPVSMSMPVLARGTRLARLDSLKPVLGRMARAVIGWTRTMLYFPRALVRVLRADDHEGSRAHTTTMH